MTTELYHPLTTQEQQCLSCPLAECDDDDELCMWRQVEREDRRTRWDWLHEQVEQMQAGDEPVVVYLPTKTDTKNAAHAAAWKARQRGMSVRVRRCVEDGRHMLRVWRVDA